MTKEFHLSYSHRLDGLVEGHPCARLHGHNGVVMVVLAAESLDKVGFVKDYGDLAPLSQWIDAVFDHQHLNDVVAFNPTAELLAKHVFEWCDLRGWPVSQVGWCETPKTWAWYSTNEPTLTLDRLRS